MIESIPAEIWLVCVVTALVAGLVKGMVGFGMPMLLISGISTFAAPELALAALILPTLFSNLAQTARGGWSAAIATLHNHWRFIAILLVVMGVSAQFVQWMSSETLLLCIGVPITLLALLQLSGWRPEVIQGRRLIEGGVATLAGITGGIGGVWGPPTTLYLTAIGTEKTEQLRAQGVIYGIGSVMLLVSHIRSGIVTTQTFAISAFLLIPALAGVWAGFRLNDRMDQEGFRQITLVVLVLAGLNLIRRGLVGA